VYHFALFIECFLNCRPVDFIGEHSFSLLRKNCTFFLHNTKSKQLQYYYRRTKDKQKSKYTSFTVQENPSRQLKRYHATMQTPLAFQWILVRLKQPGIIVRSVNLGLMHVTNVPFITPAQKTILSMPLLLQMKVRNHLR